MKIAICSMGELFGGVERHILDLCRFYRRQGLPPPLVLLFHDRELARVLRAEGIDPVIVRGRGRYDPALVGRVAGLLAGAGIDVVHAHGYKATIVAGLAAGKAGCRAIKTEHGRLEAGRNRPLDWVKSRLNFRLEQWVTRRRIGHVCYVTDDIARSFDHWHRGLARSTVRNGIDPLDRSAYPRPADLPLDTFNVGIVGRVTRVKGIDFACDAFARPEVPRRAVLHVIGTGPLEDALRGRAARAADGRLRLLGFKRNVFDYLAHLDLLLMPSLHEGLPYALLEAWSLGCPLAVSRVGGLAEVLPEVPGISLYEVGDVAGIAGAVAAAERAGRDGRPALPPCPLTLEAMGAAYLDIMGGPAKPAAGEAGRRD